MSIHCKCPTCGNAYTFPALHAGKHVSCAGCQSVFAIPIPAVDLTPAAPALVPRSADVLGLDALPESTAVSHPTARPGKSRLRGRRSKFKLSDVDNQTLVIGSAGGAGLLLLVLLLAMVFLRSGDPKLAAPVLTAVAAPAPPSPPASQPVVFSAPSMPVPSVPPPVAGPAPVVFAPVSGEPAQEEPPLTPPPRTDPAATPENPPATAPAASPPAAAPPPTPVGPAKAPIAGPPAKPPGKAAD